MTPLHTAGAKINAAALMCARGLVHMISALSALYVLKSNVHIMITLHMGAAGLCIWQSIQVCSCAGASCWGILF